jgi:hypothetical protein
VKYDIIQRQADVGLSYELTRFGVRDRIAADGMGMSC